MIARFDTGLLAGILLAAAVHVGCGDDDDENPTGSGSQDMSHVVAATSGGIFLSADGGTSWTATAIGDTTGALYITTAGEILSATIEGAFVHSSDQGESWTAGGSLPQQEIYSLIVTDRGDVLAGADDEGAWRLATGADSWIPINEGLPSADCDVRRMLPYESAILLGSSCGLFVSNDGGDSWLPTGFIDDVDAVGVDGGHIYVGTEHDGIFRSPDGGATFTHVLQANAMVLPFAFNSRGYIFAGSGGVWRSIDDGLTWSPMLNSPPQAYVLTMLVDSQDQILAGLLPFGDGASGVFRSSDDGETWAPSGLAGMDVYALASAAVLRCIHRHTVRPTVVHTRMLTGDSLYNDDYRCTSGCGAQRHRLGSRPDATDP